MKIPHLPVCLVVALSFLPACSTKADGWLFLHNTTNTLVLERDVNTLLTSPVLVGDGKIELLYAPLGTTDLNLFHTIAGVNPLGIAPVAGRFQSGSITLNDIGPGATISAIIRGWTGSSTSWLDAVNSGTAKVGVSSIFVVDTTDPHGVPIPLPPASIVYSVPGQGFSGLVLEGVELLNPNVVPEPTSMALAVIGAASLLVFRRRK